ncbi:MAG: LysM peptidoglycan-binding domain-containing protein [Candidatus Cloacimonetes bacterium]|nr:LysM peptidoglycan-binding domain-containing protein [Candidatus Cloacimonadota bacterium]
MQRSIILIVLFSLLTACSFQRDYDLSKVINKPDLSEDFWVVERDSLQQRIDVQEEQIDSLNAIISLQDSLISEMEYALNEADQMIAIRQGFQIPETISFAGVLFDLKNERIADKFIKIYNQELKDAQKYIPRSGRYFAYFDSVFTRNGVPVDAKYLAVAESRLSYLAQSPVGAMGIWQFMKSTATGYGMRVDEFIDQRRDVFLATEAAADFLLNNYKYLQKKGVNDWLLAFCGYNAGIGNVEKVIREQGGKTFFDLIMGVDETNRYVWKAVALKLIFENESEIFKKTFTRQQDIHSEIKIVNLKLNGYYEIDDWAQAQGTFISRVWELNPWIKTYQRSRKTYSAVLDVVLPPGEYKICLPVDAQPDIKRADDIEKQFLNSNDGYFTEYIVKKGDNLSKIAAKFKTSISKLKSINGLHSDLIRSGQKLKIFGYSKTAANQEYIVKKGDYISGIASRLGVTTSHLLSTNNLKKDDKGNCYIYPGQKLRY